MTRERQQRAEHVDVILDSIADGVFTVDKSWKITSFNKAAELITGFSREEAVGQYCHEIFRTSVCMDNCALRETMETNRNIVNKEINILNRWNQQTPVSISTAVLRDRRGRIIGGVESFRDLSLIKELNREIHEKYSFQDIISKHPSIVNIFRILPDIAQSDATVLIQGESGTGKELFAQAIHNLSPRHAGPMINVNCAALPETLLESELFGYVKGAFTDAKGDKPGRFQRAQGGTIFLDEIGDITPGTQVKLLRVLETKEFEPLGSTKTLRVDVRILTATNKDLSELVSRAVFRDDLYYRLNVVRIDLPPLRDRRPDIPLLIDHFLALFNRKTGKQITGVSDQAMFLLLNYHFPGNIRELENIIEHSFILCKGPVIELHHLPAYLRDEHGPSRPVHQTIEDVENIHILETLRKHGGNMTHAAVELGIHRSTLWRKIKKLGRNVA